MYIPCDSQFGSPLNFLNWVVHLLMYFSEFPMVGVGDDLESYVSVLDIYINNILKNYFHWERIQSESPVFLVLL